MDELIKAVREAARKACEQYGAFAVRKAAIRQMRGDSKALEEVGLGNYAHVTNHVYSISHEAFSLMSEKEKFDDFEYHFGKDYDFWQGLKE